MAPAGDAQAQGARSAGWSSTRSPSRPSAPPPRTPRDLDQDLVDAQETRRILDRLYGYEVSPVLWKKVMPKLSAGRVQSVATRIVVERERERMKFVSASYWDISAKLDAGADADAAHVRRPARRGRRHPARHRPRLRPGRQAQGRAPTCCVLDEAEARAPGRRGLDRRRLTVASVEEKPYTRKPYAPFMTSTLQQEAGRKLRFSADRTMRIAQRLYENGYITYMRTDCTTLSETAIAAARSQATRALRRRSTSRRSRASTPARSRTRRRRTRRSARPARCSAPPARSPASWSPTSSGSTS